ncbi:MAG: hypothetical protein M1826_001461 [Phylliscum demangeonii]|nr:MAG: hypothetical protein M1826_001461 [Phylliscum demangeonii]
MCQTIEWASTVCHHSTTFKPLGDCAHPAPAGSCHEITKSLEYHTPCRACLKAEARGPTAEIKMRLAIYWAYECHRWASSMQALGHKVQLPAGVLPHDGLTEAEHDEAGRAARVLTERLLRPAEPFNKARWCYRELIQREIADYRRRGFPGPFRLPETNSPQDIPRPVPEHDYRALLCYLGQWQKRREHCTPDAPVAPPRVDNW